MISRGTPSFLNIIMKLVTEEKRFIRILQISFNKSLFDLPFETVMKDYSNTIEPGIMLGKENGLTLMLDAEVYDYAFSPQRGEGFKVRADQICS